MDDELALERLSSLVRRDIEVLAYPAGNWVAPVKAGSSHVYDVLIVGGGQSGLACAFALIRDGISNICVIDRAEEGFEGPWESFARMAELRTPKYLVGTEGGLPNLSVRAWYEAKYGAQAWQELDRVPRSDWMKYLRWYRKTLGIPVLNRTALTGVEPTADYLRVLTESPDGASFILARRLVLATGYDGAGSWSIPPHVASKLPPERCLHSNGPIDFEPMRGKRIGILGHGASAFDAAITALRGGARSVDLCFRRPALPSTNPHRWIEYVGFLKHFPDLDDHLRWSVVHHFKQVDQPPARNSFSNALTFPNFNVHAGTPWNEVSYEADAVLVDTPRRRFTFDYVICATGSTIDLESRPEFSGFAGSIARWQDRYEPPEAETNPLLAKFPYLGKHYELQEAHPGEAPFLNRIYAFNFAAIVSMGPHSTSISGHKYSIPRMIAGLTKSLFLEQRHALVAGLKAYEEPEIVWPAERAALRPAAI